MTSKYHEYDSRNHTEQFALESLLWYFDFIHLSVYKVEHLLFLIEGDAGVIQATLILGSGHVKTLILGSSHVWTVSGML